LAFAFGENDALPATFIKVTSNNEVVAEASALGYHNNPFFDNKKIFLLQNRALI
jgi:hypothetical protein